MGYGDPLVTTDGPSYGQNIVNNVGSGGGDVANPLTADLNLSTFDLVSGANHVISYTAGKVRIDDGADGARFGGDINMQDNATLYLATDNSASIVYDGTEIAIGGRLRFSNRVQLSKGDDVAAANTLVLGNFGNLFHITGATQINLLSASGWQGGSEVTLIFDAAPTVKHNQVGSNKILLAGGVDFVASANDTLTLVFDGTNWYEKCRTVI